MQKPEIFKENKFFKMIMATAYLLTVICILAFTVRQGVSQYLITLGAYFKSVSRVSRSINIDSTNPNAYRVRGILYQGGNKFEKAAVNFKEAVSLRPNDYFLWLHLGYADYRLDDFENSKYAYERAIALAPNYAQPQQYLGLLYLRENDSERGFAYLSEAATHDPTLLQTIFSLAAEKFPDDPAAFENAVNPQSVEAKKEVADYFIDHDMMSDKIKDFLRSKDLTDDSKNDIINQLIKKKNFQLAFAVWTSKGNNDSIIKNSGDNAVLDGDFENNINSDEKNFGWQTKQRDNIKVSLDNKNANSGKAGFKVQFDGKSDPGNPFLSQLLLIKPNQKYSLTFAAKTRKIVSGGLPVVTVFDMNSGKIIGQSARLVSETDDEWKEYKIDFETAQTEAITISVQRASCGGQACPIFGTLWLDRFLMAKN